MPVIPCQFKSKVSNLLDKNRYISSDLVNLINSNDILIQKTYLKKIAMLKSRPLPVVYKSVDSGLLVEMPKHCRLQSYSISSSQPIPIAVVGDKSYYYKLPSGTKIRNIINDKLSIEFSKHSKSRKCIQNVRYGDNEFETFKNIRDRLTKFGNGNSIPKNNYFPEKKNNLFKMQTLSNESTGAAKSSIVLTNETDLMPEHFVMKSSAINEPFPAFSTYLSKGSKKQIELSNSLVQEYSSRSQGSYSKLKTMMKSIAVKKDFKEELIDKRKKGCIFPIVPNNVFIEDMPTGGNIMEGEDSTFNLSLLYTEFKIKSTGRAIHRTFSGTFFKPLRVYEYAHDFYSGNFGCIDGISVDSTRQLILDPSANYRKDFLANPQEMSRESFLALSHMFNLRKLIGKPNLPIMDLVSQRSGSDNSVTCSVYENIRVEDIDTESIESVDFALVNQFTERINDTLKEMNSQGTTISHEDFSEEIKNVTNEIISMIFNHRRNSSIQHSENIEFQDMLMNLKNNRSSGRHSDEMRLSMRDSDSTETFA